MSTQSKLEPTPAAPFPVSIDGLSAVVDSYESFIVDLWGVVHNGVAPFPGVVDCLNRLVGAGKRVCLLTNAPRRSTGNIARLEGMGIPRTCYTTLVSSGEAAYRALKNRPDAFHQSLGNRCFHLGPVRDCDVHSELGLHMVAAPEAASFVLNTGIDDPTETLEQHLPLLERACATRLPMLCVNPDLVVVIGDRRAICAGELARAYEELGGDVAYHGKPHTPVYQLALEELDHPDGRAVLCVGDAFHTDITGAVRAGHDALFVTSGIHADELRDKPETAISDLIERYGVAPTYAGPGLSW